jgi:serine/threonine protein phosphatase PrpC
MGRFWWTCAELSDVGRIRRENEDSVFCSAEAGVFVVADGMGGHAAGEVASAIASEMIGERLCYMCGEPIGLDEAREGFRVAFAEAGKEIVRQAGENVSRVGMGTTATVLVLLPDAHYIVGHIGDSRAYLMRGGVLAQITRDHSWVQEQVERGVITPEQARHHPQSNIITRALGTDRESRPDLYINEVQGGDRFLLASDGLTDMLSEERIAMIMESETDPQATVSRLVKEANLAGGLDNITALEVVVHEREPE